MCLYINADNPVAKVAETDMTVWKIIRHNNMSLFMFFRYNRHNKYSVELEVLSNNTVESGFHAYITKDIAIERAEFYKTVIGMEKLKVVQFTIPKGAQYYIGWCGKEIASNEIIAGDLRPCQ